MTVTSIEDEAAAAHAVAVTDLLAEFGERYGFTPTPRQEEAWWNEFQHTPWPILKAAADDYFAHEQFAPKGGRFREMVNKHARIAARRTERSSCAGCDGSGWINGEPEIRLGSTLVAGQRVPRKIEYETVAPCEACRPQQFAEWAKPDGWASQVRRVRRTSETLLPANPRVGIAEARRVLAGDFTRDAADL